jgi:hypothetical protein
MADSIQLSPTVLVATDQIGGASGPHAQLIKLIVGDDGSDSRLDQRVGLAPPTLLSGFPVVAIRQDSDVPYTGVNNGGFSPFLTGEKGGLKSELVDGGLFFSNKVGKTGKNTLVAPGSVEVAPAPASGTKIKIYALLVAVSGSVNFELFTGATTLTHPLPLSVGVVWATSREAPLYIGATNSNLIMNSDANVRVTVNVGYIEEA